MRMFSSLNIVPAPPTRYIKIHISSHPNGHVSNTYRQSDMGPIDRFAPALPKKYQEFGAFSLETLNIQLEELEE